MTQGDIPINNKKIVIETSIVSAAILLFAIATATAAVVVPQAVYGQGPSFLSEQDRAWQESSEILSEAVEDLREQGELNEEADLGAEAITRGTEEEEEEEEVEETAID